MIKTNLKFLISISLFMSLNSYAEDNEFALKETQNFLRDPSKVKKETLSNPEAQKADKNAEITALGRSEYKQDIYNISADLMPWLVEITKGDPNKMNELLIEAQKNPEAFYARFPASEKAKIKALSESIESSRTKKKTP